MASLGVLWAPGEFQGNPGVPASFPQAHPGALTATPKSINFLSQIVEKSLPEIRVRIGASEFYSEKLQKSCADVYLYPYLLLRAFRYFLTAFRKPWGALGLAAPGVPWASQDLPWGWTGHWLGLGLACC